MTTPTSFLHKTGRLAALFSCSLSLLLGLLLPQAVHAGTVVNLFNSFAGNINYVVTGNTLRTQANTPAGGNPCLVGTTSTGTVSGIPAGSTITAAYLYWAGSGTADYNVTLNGTAVTAAAGRQYTDTFNNGGTDNLSFFSGAADVTSIVNTAGGNATYTFAGLTVQTADVTGSGQYCSDSAVLAGWTLVVIYNKATENNRVINIFEGFEAFHNSNITLNPNNFQIPASSIDGKFTVITWEGDPDLNTGEDLRFNNNVLTDGCNGANNQYNSTINTLKCTGTAATDDVYYGVDVDTFNISSYISSGQTAATTYYQAGGDLVYLSAQVISVANVPVSDLSITKTDGAASVQAGNNTTYTLTVANNGPAVTAGTTTVTDVLPSGATFVSATGTGWTCGNVSGTVTCTRSDVLASGSSYPAISLAVSVDTTSPSSLANTASVSGGNFDNVSGNSSATDTDTIIYPADDLQITKTAVGTFTAGTPVSYTLVVKNNGPVAIPTGTTTTVTDTLPAALTYISATGTGWTCSAAGQLVTCTTTSSATSGANLSTITLTALLSSSVAANVVNTATVSNAFIADGTAGNNSSTSTVTNASINKPNYSTSTKTWVDLNGGDVAPGDTLEYTITVKDSAAAAGTNIEVTDDIPVEATSYSIVSIPAGSSNASTGTGTGANGTGFLDITGISVPASGTATIVVDVVLKGTLVAGDTVDNSATVVGGTATATPTAPTATVNQSQIGSSGNKILYINDATPAGTANDQILTRTPQAANTGTTVSIPGASATADWPLSPVVATGKSLVLPAQTVTVTLIVTNTLNSTGSNRAITVQLRTDAGTVLGTSAGCGNCTSATAVVRNFTVTIPATTIAAGHWLVMRVTNPIAQSNRNIDVSQKTAALGASSMTLSTSTVINVDSINVYSAAYNSSSTQSIWEPNATVYIRAVVSDPFGCNDVFPTGGTAPKLTLKDSSGTVILNAVTMTEPAADLTACTTTPTTATKTFEYYVSGTTGYTLLNTAVEGFWTPSVTATEGTEAAVTHTANGSFEVRRPSLLILKSVSVLSDTTGNAKPRAYAGSVTQYSIVVSNTGKGRANGVSVSDPIPTNVSYVIGSTSFTDGSTSSGLSAPTFSFYSDAGCSVSYTPSGSAGTADATVKCVKATFTAGTFMNGQTGASAPTFTLKFNTQVN